MGPKTVSLSVALVLILGGCAAGNDEVAEDLAVDTSTVSENPYGGFPVDPPAPDETVLSLEGATSLELSLDDLREMPSTTVTILEPFVQQTATFEGVDLEALLALSDIGSDAVLETVALNEYIFEDSAQALVDAGAIIAYAENGGIIAMDRGGPIRLVFAEESPYFEFLDAWNWSLRTIRETPE